jgi:hypothetical protein
MVYGFQFTAHRLHASHMRAAAVQVEEQRIAAEAAFHTFTSGEVGLHTRGAVLVRAGDRRQDAELRADPVPVGAVPGGHARCQAVVSALSKAQVTVLIKKRRDVTLTIGDGANDVGMFEQAHVGGWQAVALLAPIGSIIGRLCIADCLCSDRCLLAVPLRCVQSKGSSRHGQLLVQSKKVTGWPSAVEQG